MRTSALAKTARAIARIIRFPMKNKKKESVASPSPRQASVAEKAMPDVTKTRIPATFKVPKHALTEVEESNIRSYRRSNIIAA